jgi:methylenetetrahydrofolate dehydrogenase (NADP+)/methenyltetrahydrofolate cyclohydrolase
MIKIAGIEIEGKNVVIVGRSNIVGKPLAALFLIENATVTICHSKTNNLQQKCKEADILIAAIGKANFFTKEYVSENQAVIDVGMNLNSENKLCGDVDFEDVKDIVGFISPVPGGVGPMTVTMLLYNLIQVTKKQNNL